MQVHITMEPAGRNIVPVQRWLYLETEDIKAHCNKFGVVTWGSRQQMAERLQMRHVQYNDVLHARHLRKMLEQEGTPDTTSERKLLVNKLMLKPVPAPGDLPVPAPRRPPPPRAGPATAAAAAPAPDNVLPPVAAAAKAPKQWKIELVKKHRALCAQGSKLTKERCALWLENWGKLEEGDAVYHIISPAAGGKDHPHNYCVLPGYFPADYHLSEEKADLHHMLMLELLGETQVRTALRAGLEGEADGVTEAEDRLNEIKAMFKKLKANANDVVCGPSTAKPPTMENATPPPGQAPAAGPQPPPTGGNTGSNERARANDDGAGPSRARGDSLDFDFTDAVSDQE